MSRKTLLILPAMALLALACGVGALLPGAQDIELADGLPDLETDEDKVIESIESGEAWSLYDLINETDQGEMLRPGVQRYTVEISAEDVIDLSTGWCAKNTVIMEENEQHVTGSVTVDGFVIPDDQLFAFTSDVPAGESDDYPDGLACYSWDTVATNWPVGKHIVIEAWTLDAPLNDGYSDYLAGDYSVEYTITVTE